jgi:hypothetical protein
MRRQVVAVPVERVDVAEFGPDRARSGRHSPRHDVSLAKYFCRADRAAIKAGIRAEVSGLARGDRREQDKRAEPERNWARRARHFCMRGNSKSGGKK